MVGLLSLESFRRIKRQEIGRHPVGYVSIPHSLDSQLLSSYSKEVSFEYGSERYR